MRKYECLRRAKTRLPTGETKQHRQNRKRKKMNHSRRVGWIYAQDWSGIFSHVCGHVTEAPHTSLSLEELLSERQVNTEIWLHLKKGHARVAAYSQAELALKVQKLGVGVQSPIQGSVGFWRRQGKHLQGKCVRILLELLHCLLERVSKKDFNYPSSHFSCSAGCRGWLEPIPAICFDY